MLEVAQEGEADRVGGRAVDRLSAVEPSASVRSRTRSGRMSVFWWPTAVWLVSGATTVTSPIGSRACLSASSPRDSMPSSLVTRIRGRVVQSPSGLAEARSVRRRRASAATRGAAGDRLAALQVQVAPLRPGPLAGHVRLLVGLAPPALRRRRVSFGAAAPSVGRLTSRRSRRRARAHAATRIGRPSRASTRLAARSVDRRRLSLDRPRQCEEESADDRRDRDPEDRPGDARDLGADEDRAQDDDRVDADRVRHQARLEDVHDHEPADAHEDERRARRDSGWVSRATATGGSQATNGPKNGMAMQHAGGDRGDGE